MLMTMMTGTTAGEDTPRRDELDGDSSEPCTVSRLLMGNRVAQKWLKCKRGAASKTLMQAFERVDRAEARRAGWKGCPTSSITPVGELIFLCCEEIARGGDRAAGTVGVRFGGSGAGERQTDAETTEQGSPVG
jgi:hypothetical protein